MFNDYKKKGRKTTSTFNPETLVIYIGILTLPLSYNKMFHLEHNNINLPAPVDLLKLKIHSSYYNDHYEKWLNMADIRAVPILLNDTDGKI